MIDHYDILLLLSTELRATTIDWPSTIFHISYFITHEAIVLSSINSHLGCCWSVEFVPLENKLPMTQNWKKIFW